MAYTTQYGKLIKEPSATSAIHVAPFGDSNCLFLSNRDAADDGTAGGAIYFTDPDHTPGNEATTADQFFVNGEYQYWQCQWATKSDGSYRRDFWLYLIDSLNTNFKPVVLLSGNYGTVNVVNPREIKMLGDGLVLFGIFNSTVGGQKESTKIIHIGIMNMGGSGMNFNDCLLIGNYNNQTFLTPSIGVNINSSIMIGDFIGTSQAKKAINDNSDNIFTNDANFRADFVHTSSRNYYGKLSNASTTHSNRKIYTVLGSTNIDSDPEFNQLFALRDPTVKLSTAHFRNGAINNSDNIANARLGIAQYKADTSITEDLVVFNDSLKVVGTTITLTTVTTVKTGDSIVITGTTNYDGTYSVTANSTGTSITITDSGLTDMGLENGTVKVTGTRLVSEITDVDQQATWTDTGDFLESSVNFETKLGSAIFLEGIFMPRATEIDPTFHHLNKESDDSLKLY